MSSMLFSNCKAEPLSPISNDDVTWFCEDTLYQTYFENDDQDHIRLQDALVPCESKAEVASLMLEHLENLIDLDELIKEESFLLDEKILPILEEMEQPRPIDSVDLQLVKMEYIHQIRQEQPDTQSLLKEFETVYDVIGFSHDTLTPPQSPPSEQKILTTLEPFYRAIPDKEYSVPEKQLQPNNELSFRDALTPPGNIHIGYPSIATPQPDIAHELAVVDELVRTRVEDMQWSSSPSSPNSSSSSGSSNFGDCSSDDPEWMPEAGSDRYNSGNDEPSAEGGAPSKPSRKRSKPYSRGAPADKKSRKKEQNKNAATRYRMKKKAEVEVILTEEKQLQDQNTDFQSQISDMQREIKYLKGLMRDLFKAKGLIN